MRFEEKISKRAREIKAHIVLPESMDVRVQKAAWSALKNGIAGKISFIGDPQKIREVSKRENIDISRAEIIDHMKQSNFEEFAQSYFELRKHKGITHEEAFEKMKDPVFYGAMMVRKELASGMVAGAATSTTTILRAALTIIGTRQGTETVSSCFVMILQDTSFGMDGRMIFADCATVPSPSPLQLAEIAIAAAETGKRLVGLDPVVAMLSFSTRGSAHSESVKKVVEATDLVRKMRPDLTIDGELQADAALVEEVARKKCPDSPVKGRANILIFPDLNAGNIGYKLVQRLGNAQAYGPILQGLARPVNDLSRGCSVDDIQYVMAITSIQSVP